MQVLPGCGSPRASRDFTEVLPSDFQADSRRQGDFRRAVFREDRDRIDKCPSPLQAAGWAGSVEESSEGFSGKVCDGLDFYYAVL